ncbi:ABC transporter ATP-binding protein [Actinotalea sp. K2]|uniref:ABC transporter ATP-binding protein n=1 Tax=Actinotalea sp. K2 TaxID=2939438 RepID=UPI002017E1E7|nr:ABC transporter ATP-binding protein [Actinotalea sp. K2]MCL3861707.1 ABC transporter ATP-binding protein/permease [Actinotalea sp. K2]
MLRALHRLLPAADARALSVLTAWLVASAVLQGVVLGVAGVAVAALVDTGYQGARPWLVALAVTAAAFVVVQWVAQMIAFRTGSQTARALHLSLGEHVARVPLGWFTPARQAELVDTATTGVPQLMSYPAILLRPAITAAVTPVAAAATLAVLDWRFSLAVLAACVVAWYVSTLSRHLAQTVDDRGHRTDAEAAHRILEYAVRQPVIRTDLRPEDDDVLERALHEAARESRRSTVTVLPGLLLFSFTLNALFAALIAVGVLWVTDATLSAAAFVGLLVTTARLISLVAAGAELAAGLCLQRGALDRIGDVLGVQPLEVLDVPGAQPEPRDEVLVEVQGVTFGYDDTTVIDDVSFTLPRRGLTALVGPSGSGKTTISRLLARFWDPRAGRVLLAGADLRTLEPDALYAGIAMVLQDDYLPDGTIGQNIRAANPGATQAELDHAVHAAGLDSTIVELPAGLDTPNGPGGSRLSGGQRQRVSIARALLKAAPLTIMDEATSALDPENARLVSAAARELARTSSVLVIAHHLDTVVHADQVLVLDRGRIVQQGTHAQLLDRPGRYRELLRDHAGGEVAGVRGTSGRFA